MPNNQIPKKIFEMYIVSQGDIDEAEENQDFYPVEEILDRLKKQLEEYNNHQDERLEIYVTGDCFQVHVDKKPIYEYRGPDARSFAASCRVHGILKNENGTEDVLIAGWWGFQRLSVDKEQFCTRVIHPSLLVEKAIGDSVRNLRD